MTSGWRERLASCNDTTPLMMYQTDNRLEYVFYGEPPVVLNIDDELVRVWGVSDDGVIRIHTTRGPITYDVIGSDAFRMCWVAILRQEPPPE